MSWLERKYVTLLSSSLDKFKQKSTDLWNFRCPECGDSKDNKNKARGYLFQKKGNYYFHCHNCSASFTFKNFLKKYNSSLYDEYMMERFGDKTEDNFPTFQVEPKKISYQITGLKKVSQLPSDHPCKKYIIRRQIPTPYHAKLFFCEKFKAWVNSILPDKFESLSNDGPRLIIPFYNSSQELIGFQGRSLSAVDKVRYITIMLREDQPRIFNLDTLDMNYKYYVFEGPIDAMFINNSIATCGGSLTSELEKLSVKSNAVVVYDNEPRNKEVVKNILTAIQKGYKVCLWPPSTEQKDINDMILKKVSGEYVKTELVARAAEKIKQVIDENTFVGLDAELKLTEWKKA